MTKVIKISRRSLVRLVEQELALEGIEWANVGGDGRRWLGGMNLAKYPGPWASGHEPLIGDDESSDELDSDAGTHTISEEEELQMAENKITRRRLRKIISEELSKVVMTREEMLNLIQSELEDSEDSENYLTVNPQRKLAKRREGG